MPTRRLPQEMDSNAEPSTRSLFITTSIASRICSALPSCPETEKASRSRENSLLDRRYSIDGGRGPRTVLTPIQTANDNEPIAAEASPTLS